MSKVLSNFAFELSLPVQASFPELGFETAVEAASSTSPPPDSQPAWKGEVSNKFEPINDFDTKFEKFDY